ncbi:MAG: hypothetical protein AB1439_07295 [candidate division FCPU426 bacterium]
MLSDLLAVASILLSIFALIVSVVNLWLTFYHKGKIRMTQPTVVYLGPDGAGENQVFLRTLLFSTSKKGNVIENMFAKVKRGENTQVFNIWVYKEKELVRGSGLFVGENGVALNHHFLLPKDGTQFEFIPGEYFVEIFVKYIGRSRILGLFKSKFTLSDEASKKIKTKDYGAYFDWEPEANSYNCHIYKRKTIADEIEIINKLKTF